MEEKKEIITYSSVWLPVDYIERDGGFLMDYDGEEYFCHSWNESFDLSEYSCLNEVAAVYNSLNLICYRHNEFFSGKYVVKDFSFAKQTEQQMFLIRNVFAKYLSDNDYVGDSCDCCTFEPDSEGDEIIETFFDKVKEETSTLAIDVEWGDCDDDCFTCNNMQSDLEEEEKEVILRAFINNLVLSSGDADIVVDKRVHFELHGLFAGHQTMRDILPNGKLKLIFAKCALGVLKNDGYSFIYLTREKGIVDFDCITYITDNGWRAICYKCDMLPDFGKEERSNCQFIDYLSPEDIYTIATDGQANYISAYAKLVDLKISIFKNSYARALGNSVQLVTSSPNVGFVDDKRIISGLPTYISLVDGRRRDVYYEGCIRGYTLHVIEGSILFLDPGDSYNSILDHNNRPLIYATQSTLLYRHANNKREKVYIYVYPSKIMRNKKYRYYFQEGNYDKVKKYRSIIT
jgi:hypothetical protein